MSDPRGPLRGYGKRVNGRRQRFLKSLQILNYEVIIYLLLHVCFLAFLLHFNLISQPVKER